MGTTTDTIREPVVAGMFYPLGSEDCRQAVESLFARPSHAAAKRPWKGAMLPHAGWMCSGEVAAEGIEVLHAGNPSPDVIVIFGAVHTVGGLGYGALDDHADWRLPTGLAHVSDAGQSTVLAAGSMFRVDPRVHRREHAIEVLIPLIQHAWPGVDILPIEVPPIDRAADLGRLTARALARDGRNPLYIASSDLTHYGPNYGLTLAGDGEEAMTWADANDGRLIDLVKALRADHIVRETEESQNACGGGAIAALLGACAELGATHADLIRHTNSYRVLSEAGYRQRADNFVGYAAMTVV